MATQQQKREEFERWQKESDARHAEWERLAIEHEQGIQAELDAKCPASEGWYGSGMQVRFRLRARLSNGPEMYGDGI